MLFLKYLDDFEADREATAKLSGQRYKRILADEYRLYFRELRAYHVMNGMNGMILSHIPLHSDSMGHFGTNIHGHSHANRVKRARGVDARTGEVLYSDENDIRYHCVCVEQTPEFAPILFEEVIARIEAEGDSVGFKNGNGPTM